MEFASWVKKQPWIISEHESVRFDNIAYRVMETLLSDKNIAEHTIPRIPDATATLMEMLLSDEYFVSSWNVLTTKLKKSTESFALASTDNYCKNTYTFLFLSIDSARAGAPSSNFSDNSDQAGDPVKKWATMTKGQRNNKLDHLSRTLDLLSDLLSDLGIDMSWIKLTLLLSATEKDPNCLTLDDIENYQVYKYGGYEVDPEEDEHDISQFIANFEKIYGAPKLKFLEDISSLFRASDSHITRSRGSVFETAIDAIRAMGDDIRQNGDLNPRPSKNNIFRDLFIYHLEERFNCILGCHSFTETAHICSILFDEPAIYDSDKIVSETYYRIKKSLPPDSYTS